MLLLLHGALPAAACIPLTRDVDDELVWPAPGETTTPDAWVFVGLRRAKPRTLVLVDPEGEEVAIRHVPIGPGDTATVHALIPLAPLTPGTYSVRGLVDDGWDDDATFTVEAGELEPVVPPILLQRVAGADIEREEPSTSCSCCSWEDVDRLTYSLCGDQRVTVVAFGEERPPGRAPDVGFDFARVEAFSNSAFPTQLAFGLSGVAELAAGQRLTVWVGAMDVVGNVAWAEPDTFVMPEDDWIVTTDAASTDLVDAECPAWEGWGPSERECGGPDCREGDKGCATSPGAPIGALLGVLPMVLRGRVRRARARPSRVERTTAGTMWG